MNENPKEAGASHDLVLSIRGANLMKHVGAGTVGELVRLTADEILAARCFGETSLREIQEGLSKRGLRLGMSAAELRGMKGLDGKIVAQQSTDTKPIADHEHNGACCGHCEQPAQKLRNRVKRRNAKAKS